MEMSILYFCILSLCIYMYIWMYVWLNTVCYINLYQVYSVRVFSSVSQFCLVSSLGGTFGRGWLNWLTAVSLDEFDHLGDCLRRQDGQQVCYEKELVCFIACWLPGAELAQSDALAVVWTATSTINKGWMEPVHIEVIIVDKEALSDSRVPVVQSMHIKPTKKQSVKGAEPHSCI